MRILHPIKAKARGRRGGVLVLSLIAVGVVASLSVAYLRLTATVARSQIASSDMKLSFYLAEAGLAESYSGLMVGHTGAVGSASQPVAMGEGLYWVEAIQLDDDHLRLDSTGMVKSGKAVLSMVVRCGSPNVGSLGVFSENDLTVGDGSLIDGYDSTLGSYEEQKRADPASVQNGRLGSNGDVSISATLAPTDVHGDVAAGPSGAVTLEGSPTITGSSGSSSSLVALAAPTPPEVTTYAGVSHPEGTPLVVPSGVMGAEYLELQENAQAQLVGPQRLVLGGLRLAPGAELTFDTTDGPIELFVSNELTVDPAAVLTNAEADATRVTINVEGEATVDLAANDDFYGLVYAPDSAVSVAAGFELFGSIVASSLTLAGGVALHYDEALVAANARDTLPRLLSWRILELGESSPDTVSVDPFNILGVDPATAFTPREGHQDQTIDVAYRDFSDVSRTYSGLESGFDWSQVKVLERLVRSGGLIQDDVVGLSRDGALLTRGG